MITVLRLDDHWNSNVFRGFPSVLGALDRATFRSWYSNSFQEHTSQVLVLCDRLRDGARCVSFRRTYTALMHAVTELYQTPFIESAPWNTTGLGGIDNRFRTWAQADIVAIFFQFLDLALDTKGTVVHGGHQQLKGLVQAKKSQLFLAIRNRDLVHPLLTRLASSAKSNGRPRKRLKLECDMLENMSHISSAAQANKKPATFPNATSMLDHRWQPCHQSLVEPRNHFRGSIFQLFEVYPSLQHW